MEQPCPTDRGDDECADRTAGHQGNGRTTQQGRRPCNLEACTATGVRCFASSFFKCLHYKDVQGLCHRLAMTTSEIMTHYIDGAMLVLKATHSAAQNLIKITHCVTGFLTFIDLTGQCRARAFALVHADLGLEQSSHHHDDHYLTPEAGFML